MTTSIETRWLPTGQAARELGISPDSLKRYADRDEVLVLGEHWRHGVHSNSPRVWNLPLCLQALNHRGRLQRQQPAPSAIAADPGSDTSCS